MNRSRVLEWIARGAAATIVLAGILDPAVTVSRATKPVISIVSTDTARFAATVRKVEQAVSGAGISVVGSLPEAAAQIVVGSRVSPAMLVRDIPTYVVATGTRGGVHAEAITVPPTAPLDTRIPVTVLLSRAQATGTNTETDTVRAIVELREDGLPLARTVVALTPAQRLQVPLHFTPSRAGAHRLTVSLIEQGDSLTWTRDIVTGPSRWQVLFHDQRPSWLSTFVRRAIASDERFRVSSRIVTSTNVSRTTPGAARSLAALDGGPLPDVLVIGAPELLSRSDMAALEHLVAERGLSVVLLPDHPPPAQAPVSASGALQPGSCSHHSHRTYHAKSPPSRTERWSMARPGCRSHSRHPHRQHPWGYWPALSAPPSRSRSTRNRSHSPRAMPRCEVALLLSPPRVMAPRWRPAFRSSGVCQWAAASCW